MSSTLPPTRLELIISCNDLPHLHTHLGATNPQIWVYLKDRNTGNQEIMVGTTEVLIKDTHHPTFAQSIIINYYFEEEQKIRFVAKHVHYHHPDNKEDIGELDCKVSDIVSSKGQTYTRPIKLSPESLKRQHGHKPSFTIKAHETNASSSTITFQFSATNLDKKEKALFPKSHPLLQISHVGQNNQKTLIARTEHILKTLDPVWDVLEVPMSKLLMDEQNPTLSLECLHWHHNGEYELIGECQTTWENLQAEKQFNLVNTHLKEHHHHHHHKNQSQSSGVLHLKTINIIKNYTFFDFLAGGLQVKLMFAIDYTGSNGNPADPNSLHHIRQGMFNPYQSAIYSVGNILLPYSSSQNIPTYGFGAKLHPANIVSHCFPIDPNQVELPGINSVISAYINSFSSLNLYGPTNFSPVINNATQIAQQMEINEDDFQSYLLLLIITDGSISDIDNTIENIVTSANLPMSIIIVGVGNEDFESMRILEGDEGILKDHMGRPCPRDTVEFVQFNAANGNDAALAAMTLSRIPSHIVSYMKHRGIKPKPPTQAVIQQ